MENTNRFIIEIEDLVYEYNRGSEPGDGEGRAAEGAQGAAPPDIVRAVDCVTLRVRPGSFTAVIGRNGSGKSTLAKNVNALLLPTAGRVVVDGFDTRDESALWEIRRRAGMVFQNPDNQLVSAVVEDDVAFGPENLGIEADEIRHRIRVALESVDMYEQRKMAPHLLSGGQKQRVAIAGVIAMRPDAILFDEPTAMLDPEGRREVMDIIHRLHAEGVTVVLITHFMSETVDADRVVIMDEGRVALEGVPTDVFRHVAQIEGLGLKLPFAVEMANRLRADGAQIPENVLTEDALVQCLAGQLRAGALEAPSSVCPDSQGGQALGAAGEPSDASPSGTPAPPAIRVRGLTHVYNKGLAYETRAIDDVSFDVERGALVGIVGHTGSGKSTLIQHLNGILKPDSGSIFIGDAEITAKGAKLHEIRKRVGLVFQYPEYQLFEETVYRDVAFGPKNLGLAEDEIAVRVREALELVNIDFSKYEGRSPFDLSGGQKRRVAIAGVIAMRPEVLILDEPTAGLDPKSHADILRMIESIRQRTGCTVVLVSHNMGDIAAMADRVLVMDRGRLLMEGAPQEVYRDGQLLAGIGLGLPPAARVASRLTQSHVPMPPAGRVLTPDDLAGCLEGRFGA